MKIMIRLLKYCLLICLTSLFNQQHIQKTKNCEFTSTESGLTYNLESMRNPTVDYSFDSSKYTYKANFCGPMIEHCNNNSLPAALYVRKSYCIGKMTMDWEFSSIDYLNPEIKTNGIKLIFNAGDKCYMGYAANYQVTYSIKCNPYVEDHLESVNKISPCSYDFIFESKHGCAVTADENSKVILTYISLGLILYILVFSYLNYKENPEDGLMKALPHREFWRSFFGNSVEGFKFTTMFIREKFNYYYSQYKGNEKYQDI